ncbi:hypothetical protein AAG906_025394 [Vitis piasezkii]
MQTLFRQTKQLREENEELQLKSRQMLSDKDTSFTRASRKKRHCRELHLFDTMRVLLGPQALGVETQLLMSETLRARLGQLVVVTTAG